MVKRREPSPKPPTIRIPAFGITLKQIAAAIGILIVSAIVIWVYINFDVVSHFVVSRTELFLSWSGLGISLICIWMGLCSWLVRSANGRSLLNRSTTLIVGIPTIIASIATVELPTIMTSDCSNKLCKESVISMVIPTSLFKYALSVSRYLTTVL